MNLIPFLPFTSSSKRLELLTYLKFITINFIEYLKNDEDDSLKITFMDLIIDICADLS